MDLDHFFLSPCLQQTQSVSDSSSRQDRQAGPSVASAALKTFHLARPAEPAPANLGLFFSAASAAADSSSSSALLLTKEEEVDDFGIQLGTPQPPQPASSSIISVAAILNFLCELEQTF